DRSGLMGFGPTAGRRPRGRTEPRRGIGSAPLSRLLLPPHLPRPRRGPGAGGRRPRSAHPGKDAMTTATPRPAPWASPRVALLLPTAACFVWSFWPTFTELVRTWRRSDQSSHGFLVPVFAGFLLWLRRERLDVDELRPAWLAGLPLLLLALGLRLAGAYYFYNW